MGMSITDLVAWTLDIVVPLRCAACGRPGAALCHRCFAAIASSPGIIRAGWEPTRCLTALGAYEGRLRSAVLALKFRGARAVGAALGRLLARRILHAYDVVVPVPLHRARCRERGYNQASEIARGIAKDAGLACVDCALVRVRETRAQSTLDLAARAANVEDAFAAGPQATRVKARRVLLVDDVITTGATMRACSRALVAAGVGAVHVAAAALRL